jgi:hypothetical protein
VETLLGQLAAQQCGYMLDISATEYSNRAFHPYVVVSGHGLEEERFNLADFFVGQD